MKNNISFITILAIEAFLGIMINIGLSYVVRWQSLEPIEFMATFKIDYPLLLLPMLLTLLPAFFGCIWLMLHYSKNSLERKYWRYALICLIVIVLQTLVFHLPKNISFIDADYTGLEARGNLEAWAISHWIRSGIALVAGVFAIMGFKKGIENSVSESKTH